MGLTFTSAKGGGGSGVSVPLDSPLLLTIPAWTNVGSPTTYGPFDVSKFNDLAGPIGLNPGGTASTAGVVIRWYIDAAATQEVGVQIFGLSYLIPSLALLHIPNQGPYFTLTITPLTGPCPVSAKLFGTNRSSNLQLALPDPILIDQTAFSIGATTSETLYPSDYYAGPIRIYLNAPAEPVYWTLYAEDGNGGTWALDRGNSGSTTFGWSTLAPFGAWYVVISNVDAVAHNVDIAVQASFTGSG